MVGDDEFVELLDITCITYEYYVYMYYIDTLCTDAYYPCTYITDTYYMYQYFIIMYSTYMY